MSGIIVNRLVWVGGQLGSNDHPLGQPSLATIRRANPTNPSPIATFSLG